MQTRPVINLIAVENQIFTNVFYRLTEAKTRYVVVYGGAASSKSYSVHQNALFEIMEPGEGDTLVIRKYAADLRDSCYKLFMLLIDKYGLRKYFKCTFSNDNRRITYIHNGRSLVFRGIDDPEKLKSIVYFKILLVEEATQLEFEDFLELNRRARALEGIQLMLVLNPVSENHWIKTKLCDEGSPYYDETSLIRCTYNDNRNNDGQSFLTDTDIRELERLKDVNENQYRIYVQAEWGVDSKENKFCWAFDKAQIKPTVYEPHKALWASFDFNVNPLTCIVAQLHVGKRRLRAIECFKLEESNIYTLCDRLTAAYPDVGWMVTGDASGNNRSALTGNHATFYRIIQEELNVAYENLKVPRSNPAIEDNQMLVNAVHKNWNIEIDPIRCQPLIYDLTYVEVDNSGAIMKDRSNAKRYADFLDCWRYLINSAVGPHFNYGWRKE